MGIIVKMAQSVSIPPFSYYLTTCPQPPLQVGLRETFLLLFFPCHSSTRLKTEIAVNGKSIRRRLSDVVLYFTNYLLTILGKCVQ